MCFLLLQWGTRIVGQGVFINPVNTNGTLTVEFVEFEQPLDFDIHDESMFATSDPRFEFPLTEADVMWLNSLFSLPEEGETRERKEYRLLTEEEREDFHRAVNMLKNDTVGIHILRNFNIDYQNLISIMFYKIEDNQT